MLKEEHCKLQEAESKYFSFPVPFAIIPTACELNFMMIHEQKVTRPP
jgi:hypothetical protein